MADLKISIKKVFRLAASGKSDTRWEVRVGSSLIGPVILLADRYRLISPHTGHIIVLESYKGIYLAIPKVANSSLKTYFANLLNLEGDPARTKNKAYIFNNPKYSQTLRRDGILVSRIEDAPNHEYWKFSFVRNPWDRLVSFYRSFLRSKHINLQLCNDFGNLFQPEMDFGDFSKAACKIPDLLTDRHLISQNKFLVERKRRLLPDFVGRYERLDDDFYFICQKLGLEVKLLNNVNPAPNLVFYQDFYTPIIRNAVAERYKDDIALFGYAF